jgi:hypothetical protein
MDRRLDQRWPANLEVKLTDIAKPQSTTCGRIVDVSHSGICVRMPLRAEPGAILKLDIADCALFGHSVHCREDGGAYEIGIEIVRVLIANSDQGRLVNTILAASMPNMPGLTVGVHESAN